MRSSLLVVCLALTVAVASAGYPFTLCDQGAHPLTVVNVDLSKPQKGQPLSIDLTGTLSQQVTGGQVIISVKLSGVDLYSETDDLSQGTPLPVGPGNLEFKKSVDIPSIAPAGNYEVDMQFNDQNNNELTCIVLKFQL